MDVSTTLSKPVFHLFVINPAESFDQNVFTLSDENEYEKLCNSHPFFTKEVQKDIEEFLQQEANGQHALEYNYAKGSRRPLSGTPSILKREKHFPQARTNNSASKQFLQQSQNEYNYAKGSKRQLPGSPSILKREKHFPQAKMEDGILRR